MGGEPPAQVRVVDLDPAVRLRLALNVWNALWSAVASLTFVALLVPAAAFAVFSVMAIVAKLTGYDPAGFKESLPSALIGFPVLLAVILVVAALLYAVSFLHRVVIGGSLVLAFGGMTIWFCVEVIRDLPAFLRGMFLSPLLPDLLQRAFVLLDPRQSTTDSEVLFRSAVVLLFALWFQWEASLSTGWKLFVRQGAALAAWTWGGVELLQLLWTLRTHDLAISVLAAWLAGVMCYERPRYGPLAIQALWWLILLAAAGLAIGYGIHAVDQIAPLRPFDVSALWLPSHAPAQPFVGLLAAGLWGYAVVGGGKAARDGFGWSPLRVLMVVICSAGVAWWVGAFSTIPLDWWLPAIGDTMANSRVAAVGFATATWDRLLSQLAAIWSLIVAAISIGVGYARLGKPLIDTGVLVMGAVMLGFVVIHVIDSALVLIRAPAIFAAARYPPPRRLWPRVKYMLGLSPIGYLSRGGSRSALWILVVGKLLLAAALLAAAAATIMVAGMGTSFVTDTLTGAAKPSLDVAGDLEVFAMFLAIAGGVFGLAYVTRLISRRLWPTRYEGVRLRDPRRPILFLRSFADDRIKIGFSPIAAVDGAASLDELLLHLGGGYGPVIALGMPDERLPPFGAARQYVREGDWHEVVGSLIEEARLVAVCVDDTPGILWEIEQLVASEALHRAIFIFPPRMPRARRDAFIGSLGFGAPPIARQQELMAFVVSGGRGIAFVANSDGISGYHCATMASLLLQLGYPEGALARPRFVIG